MKANSRRLDGWLRGIALAYQPICDRGNGLSVLLCEPLSRPQETLCLLLLRVAVGVRQHFFRPYESQGAVE